MTEGMPQDENEESVNLGKGADRDGPTRYDWRLYRPDGHNLIRFLRWLVVGGSTFAKQSDEVINLNVHDLARCLMLLREYQRSYGMPEQGGPEDQEFVLRNILIDLYAGGAPIWSLESVMQRVAEGLTGCSGVNWLILPRKAFIFAPTSGATSMFRIDRGFEVFKMERMERVVVRLASFASNTRGASNVPARFPDIKELRRIYRSEFASFGYGMSSGSVNWQSVSEQSSETSTPDGITKSVEETSNTSLEKDKTAKRILNLASNAAGLYYFVNSKSYHGKRGSSIPLDKFWIVSDEERELFSRLATIEAMKLIDRIDDAHKVLYPWWALSACRISAAAGACAIWFNGSWADMAVSGVLGSIVALIETSTFLSKQERLVVEIVASFIVGVVAGLLALMWPGEMCFGAMALSSVLDLLQGFRVVYAVIEIMSRNTISGVADLLEGMLFTALIASFLRFGQYVAASIMEDSPGKAEFEKCHNGIPEFWYIFWGPVAAFSWSALCVPSYGALPAMAWHGLLAFGVNFALLKAGVAENVNNFTSSLAVSLSAGIWSRFTGHQSVGNTVAGLYALVPGAYLVKSLYSVDNVGTDFFTEIIQSSVILGIGAWTGSILCSPTFLGTARGFTSQHDGQNDLDTTVHSNNRDRSFRTNTLLFF